MPPDQGFPRSRSETVGAIMGLSPIRSHPFAASAAPTRVPTRLRRRSTPGRAAGALQHRTRLGHGALLRNRDDRLIGGVAGGLARRVRIDATLLRVGLVFLALSGFGLIGYVVAWLVITPRRDSGAWAHGR